MRKLFGMKQSALLATAVASIFGFGMAQAAPIFVGPPTAEISVTDGVTSASCFDNDACDSDPNTGIINTSLPLDGWFVQVDIGLTKDVLGDAPNPHMDMAYQVAYLPAVGVPGDGTLKISFSDTGFTGSPKSFTSEIGGTFAGAITSAAFSDSLGTSNTLFDRTTPLCGLTFNASPFAGGCSSSYGGATPYSLTMDITLTNPTRGSGQSSGDHSLQSAPEPATLLLMGGALAGFGFFSRRRNNRA